MKRVPQGRYTKEFRVEAVKLVTAEKLSCPEAAQRLYLPTSTLANCYYAGQDRPLSKRVERSLLLIDIRPHRVFASLDEA
jgi:transposase